MSSVEESALATVQIFPNPASEYLQLDYPGKRFSDMQFELYDMQGRPVISKLVSSNEKISLHGIAKGMYIYRLMLDKTQQQGKILKQ
ncbi:MAG: T9SS type A sorting domain-containing protein [Bacteroidota bacterium]